MRLQPADVLVHALLEVRKLEEVDRIDGVQGGVAGVGGLDARAELRALEGGHPAGGVVDHRDLARAEEALRDDEAPEGVLPAYEKRSW